MIIADTNVIIEAFKGKEETIALLDQIGVENLAISSITEMELYVGAYNKRELSFMRKRIEKIRIIDFDQAISRKSAELIFSFSKSHSLDIPDSIIAATCLVYDFELFTYNKKDFRYIPDLKILKVATPTDKV
jgi:predicted nucleic acid-binding protein